MNAEYLDRAKKMVPDMKELILLASKRAEELAKGAPAFVRYESKKIRSGLDKKNFELVLDPNFIDIALLEIAEGKVTASYEPVEKKDKTNFFDAPAANADDGSTEK